MEEKEIKLLQKELNLKRFQFNAIYEFASAIHKSFDLDSVLTIFFSTLMGQMGISKVFYYDSKNDLYRKRGIGLSDDEKKLIKRRIKKVRFNGNFIEVEKLCDEFKKSKEIFLKNKIYYLINISEKNRKVYVGLGNRYNKKKLSVEDIEFCYFISKFTFTSIDKLLMVNEIIEKKRIEHELDIARKIQLSLLPDKLPELNNFDIGVVYEPINEVGGDYYDILEKRKDNLPVLIADVEGKGLYAALLAASSQAIFTSLNQLYFFDIKKFITKANSLIYRFTRGEKFITLFWLLINDKERKITYVNAGHIPPILIKKDSYRKLDKGGMISGFLEHVNYESETIKLNKGDILLLFTDGVVEVDNSDNLEFGEKRLIKSVCSIKDLSAKEIAELTHKNIKKFAGKRKLRDDFTLIVIKVR